MRNRRVWPPRSYKSLAVLSMAVATIACDTESTTSKPNHGWITNCVGPEFDRAGKGSQAVIETTRPVFKITDELVLAVPVENSPSASELANPPKVCNRLTDVPPINYLTFVIRGNWSRGYSSEDLRMGQRDPQFVPDVVAVRLEAETARPISADEELQFKALEKSADEVLYSGTTSLNGMECKIPKYGGGGYCTGSHHDPDLQVFYNEYSSTPFVFVNANYRTAQFNGVRVYFQLWTLHPESIPDVDAAIWEYLNQWRLFHEPESPNTHSTDSNKP